MKFSCGLLFVAYVTICTTLLEYVISPQMAKSIYSIAVCKDKKWTDASENDHCLFMLSATTTLMFSGFVALGMLGMSSLKLWKLGNSNLRQLFVGLAALSVAYPLSSAISHWQRLKPLSSSDANLTIFTTTFLTWVILETLIHKNYIGILRKSHGALSVKDCF
tara:strand:- start:2842 stop:3330 length:489 start_codon:yes stop_codon:yes gene_type:complete